MKVLGFPFPIKNVALQKMDGRFWKQCRSGVGRAVLSKNFEEVGIWLEGS